MNTKMKVLSLALVGLCGYAGSALAVCPAGPSIADGGAWTAATSLSGGTLAIVTPGLDASACHLTASVGARLASIAVVEDDSPTAEPRYRFQYLIDTTALTSSSLTDAIQLFVADAAAAPAAGGTPVVVAVNLNAGSGGGYSVSFAAGCSNAAQNYVCPSPAVALTPGVNRIEVDAQLSATGSVRYWVNAAAGTTEPTPTGAITGIDNSAWAGVDTAYMGLSQATPSFGAAHASQAVGFDTFDSRRQTYIGY